MSEQVAPFCLNPDEGNALWYLGGLAVFKITNEQTGSWGLCVETFPAGFASALHTHPTEDSGFYVLSGKMRVRVGEVDAIAVAGSFVWMPRGVPHAFKVEGTEPASWLNIQGPTGDFRRLTEEIGQKAGHLTLPPAPERAPDPAAMAALRKKHNLNVLGPSPFA